MKFKPKTGYCRDFFGKKYCVRKVEDVLKE